MNRHVASYRMFCRTVNFPCQSFFFFSSFEQFYEWLWLVFVTFVKLKRLKTSTKILFYSYKFVYSTNSNTGLYITAYFTVINWHTSCQWKKNYFIFNIYIYINLKIFATCVKNFFVFYDDSTIVEQIKLSWSIHNLFQLPLKFHSNRTDQKLRENHNHKTNTKISHHKSCKKINK